VILPSPYLGEGTGVRAISSVSFLFEITINLGFSTKIVAETRFLRASGGLLYVSSQKFKKKTEFLWLGWGKIGWLLPISYE